MSDETFTRCKGGTDERQEKIGSITIPDLWHIANSGQLSPEESEAVLECWNLCHDLRKHIQEQAGFDLPATT